jgi:hypothetical protein
MAPSILRKGRDLYNHRYKILLHEKALNKLLHGEITEASPEIDEFRITFYDKFSKIQGRIQIGKEYSKKLLGLKTLGFRIILVVDKIDNNTIIFNIKKFSIFIPGRKRLDILYLFSKLSNRIQRKFVEIFSELETPFVFSANLETLEMDMNYFVTSLDSLSGFLGRVRLDFCLFSKGDFVLFAYSNVILKSLIKIFGPDFISVERLDYEMDVYKLLWEI